MSSTLLRLRHLRQHDKQLWFAGVTKIVKSSCLPSASKESCVRDNGSIYYRGVYYYSNDRKFPYVRMKIVKNSVAPVITVCDKESYDKFLHERLYGQFADVDAWVCLPISYHNDKFDL